MPALGKPAPVSVEEYLAGELVAEIKHEYLGGELHAMAGATNRHNKVASNVLPRSSSPRSTKEWCFEPVGHAGGGFKRADRAPCFFPVR